MLDVFAYEQATITLEPGDLFVAFTDGISEAMTSADEEWGEERLIECVRRIREHKAGEIMANIMVSADTFVAGARQHDDMTVIVARVL